MLDPADWERFRAQAHRALDDAIDRIRDIRDEPVWRPVPDEVKKELQAPMPDGPRDFGEVYDDFKRLIWPYVTGNIHPRFLGWVHGSGTPQGAVADMLAGFMNSNVGGRDHGAVYVERQVIRWFLDLFGWPESASGILTTGSSMANFIAVLVARTRARERVRAEGVNQNEKPLVGYASSATHACVKKAFENAGLGHNALRVLPVDENHRIDLNALRAAIDEDERSGAQPFIIIGNAGTVDVGAIDPLDELATIAQQHKLWLHVDGAFGAMAYLSEKLRPKLNGIERADSIAFDFHKWLHVPYDAGCIIVKDGATHKATFASEGPYITRMPRGLGAGEPWFTDYGPELSRSFRALKVWFTIQEHGRERLAEAIETNCEQAQELARMIDASDAWERVAPVALQIVCFRPAQPDKTAAEIDAVVDDMLMSLQQAGVVTMSSTTIGGLRYLRCCFTNCRTATQDIRVLTSSIDLPASTWP